MSLLLLWDSTSGKRRGGVSETRRKERQRNDKEIAQKKWPYERWGTRIKFPTLEETKVYKDIYYEKDALGAKAVLKKLMEEEVKPNLDVTVINLKLLE
jgi:hypothetical protein